MKVGLYTLSKTFTTHGRPGNRSLGLNGSGTRPRLGPPGRPCRAGPVQVSASGLLRVTVSQARPWQSQAGSPLTWPVINCWASSKHGPPELETPGQVGPWSETQVWNFPRFSCAGTLWFANQLHHVWTWRYCEFLVFLLISMFNHKNNLIPSLINIWTWQEWMLELFADILDISTITSRRPNHHLHCSASAQINFLFYLSD